MIVVRNSPRRQQYKIGLIAEFINTTAPKKKMPFGLPLIVDRVPRKSQKQNYNKENQWDTGKHNTERKKNDGPRYYQ